MASFTSASSRGSLNEASQSSLTGPTAEPGATHCGGVPKFGIASFAISSRGGMSFSAQPASVSAVSAQRTLRSARISSVQLQYQVVRVRADADDHLADD